jgi:hypothetical protein
MTRTNRIVAAALFAALMLPGTAPAEGTQVDVRRPTADALQSAFDLEQRELGRLQGSAEPADLVQYLNLLRDGILVAAGNPLRVPQTATLRQRLDMLASEQDNPVWTEAATMLARMLLASALPEDKARARTLLEALADRNHGGSMMMLRDLLLRDTGNAANAVEADALLRRAVLAGSFDAMIGQYVRATDPAVKAGLLAAIQQEPARRIAATRDASAAVRIANELVVGTVFARDVGRAIKLYRVAMELGEPGASFQAYRRLSELDEGQVQKDVLRGFLEDAAWAGSLSAAETIIDDWMTSGPLGIEPETAALWMRHAIGAGSAPALVALDALNRRNALPEGFSPDLGTYVRTVEASPNLRPLDRVMLGQLYRDGRAVAKDAAKAKQYFESAIAGGEAGALVEYAKLVLSEPVSTADERKQGVALLEQAAASGSVSAMIALGDAVVLGRDMAYDFDVARGWYEKAIETGNSLAASRKLAELLIDRAGTPLEIDRGVAMLKDAAEANNASAMIRLADLYAKGRFVPLDRDRAVGLLRGAVDVGSARARVALADLLSQGVADADQTQDVMDLYQSAFDAGLNSVTRRLADILIAKNDGPAAIALLQRAVDRNVASAAVRLADILQEGVLVPQDIERASQVLELAISLGSTDDDVAVDLAETLLSSSDRALRQRGVDILERVANAGASDAMRSLARFWRASGISGPDMNRAVEWSQKAADAGTVSELVWLGGAYRDGNVVPRDTVRALALFERALALDPTNSAATLAVGQAYLNGIGTAADPKRAFEFFERAANRSDAEAKIVLARMLAEGLGVAPNPDAAFQQLLDAVDLGSVAAKVSLGRFYASGFGTDIVPEASFAQFMGAALGGSAEGMREVGRCYLSGFGAPLDLEQGKLWLERAARAGHSGSKVDLSVFLFAQAERFPAEAPDLNKEAMTWLASAADDGNAAALFRLGVIYYFGTGAEKDVPRALDVLNRSAALGNYRAKKLLVSIEKSEKEQKPLEIVPAEIDSRL